jgi:hypothetical protein
MLLQSGQNQLPPFQALRGTPKPASSIPSRSSQAKTHYFYFRPFHSGHNQLLPFQAILENQKLFFAIPSQSSQVKTYFLHSQAITVSPKLTSSIPRHSSQAKASFVNSKPFQFGQKQFLPFHSIGVKKLFLLVAAGHRTIQFLLSTTSKLYGLPICDVKDKF